MESNIWEFLLWICREIDITAQIDVKISKLFFLLNTIISAKKKIPNGLNYKKNIK